jgi:hypothetical protein
MKSRVTIVLAVIGVVLAGTGLLNPPLQAHHKTSNSSAKANSLGAE